MNRLKELRESKNLTFKQLSNELKSRNVSIYPDSLSKYERGARNPKIDKWQALADYFNVSVPYLQGEIFKEDLDDEAQEMFEDVQDYAGDRMTVATREKCPCCDFDSDGFGKNIIGKGYGSCEIRLYRATKYDFYIYSYSVGAEALLKDWFEIYSQKVRFCPVCGRRLAID